jgi:hypothetical protein
MSGDLFVSTTAGARCRRQFSAVAVTAGLLLLAACSAGPGSGNEPGSITATVGRVEVAYPKGWVVLGAGERPQGWDWAAQNAGGDAAQAQVAVDGDYSALDVDFSSANLLAAAQVGSLPGFAVQNRDPVTVSGAGTATRIDFTYRTDGGDFRGVWVVARSATTGAHTVVVQVTGKAPVDDALVSSVIDGMTIR